MHRFKTPKKMCHMPIVILIGCSSTVESWKRILFYSIPIQPILFILVSQVYVYFSTVGGSSFWHHAKFDDAKNQGSYTTSEFLGLRHPEGRYGQVMIIKSVCFFSRMSFWIWRGCHVFFLCKSLCPHVFGSRKVWSLYRFLFFWNSGKCMEWDVSSRWTLEKDMDNSPQNLMLGAFIPAVGPATISYTINWKNLHIIVALEFQQ